MGIRAVAVASWAVLGVVLLLGESVIRLSMRAVAGLGRHTSAMEWCALGAAMIVVGYVEGYRTFACSFGPRVVLRAFDLTRRPAPLWVAFAPLFAMSLLGDTRRRLITSWCATLAICGAILVVRSLPPTWRAIADASVAISLACGVVVICRLFVVRLRREL